MARKGGGKQGDGWTKIPGDTPINDVIKGKTPRKPAKPKSAAPIPGKQSDSPPAEIYPPAAVPPREHKPDVPYSREISDEVCRRVSHGMTLNRACNEPSMPSATAVRDWAADDIDGFASRYARARARMIEYIADDIFDIADDGSNDYMERENSDGSTYTVVNHENIARSKLRIEMRRWTLSKIMPERYGDHVTVDTPKDGPIAQAIGITWRRWLACW